MTDWTRLEVALFFAAIVVTLTLGAFRVPELPAVGIGVAPLAVYEAWQVVVVVRRAWRARGGGR